MDITTQCKARVKQGSYTYAARNKDRQCGNAAKDNGFCHLHQPIEISEESAAAFAAMRANILNQLSK